MSSVVISGDISGSVTLDAPSVAGTTVLTLPATSGTVVTTATSSGINGSAITTGTVGVSVGGSGRTTNTAYAVICGGTTTGGAEQSIASVGTTGQVLTSNGAGALPTFQTISSTPTTDQVLSATAGATGGAVGTYAFLGSLSQSNPATLVVNSNYAGSLFVFAGLTVTGGNWATTANELTCGQYGGGTPSGTWKAMGQNTRGSTENKGTIFLRVA